MLIHHLAELVLLPAQDGNGGGGGGAPTPPGLFGDSSQMPGAAKMQTVVHWAGNIMLAAAVVGIGAFATQLIIAHHNPQRHAGTEHGKSAAMIMAGLTVLGSVGAIVKFFISG